MRRRGDFCGKWTLGIKEDARDVLLELGCNYDTFTVLFRRSSGALRDELQTSLDLLYPK